ncbi:MAG: 50S ribosomal protein L23 [Patescibacteria group bacterium]|nr:MAG: 50S ribosomal protein L23 [Patescibacteria group bacterium]
MIKLRPVITEKSLVEAKRGNYTFKVDVKMNKSEIKKLVEKIFKVKVSKIRTINHKPEVKKNYLGRIVRKSAFKKAVVTLSGKDKIDLFEEKK